jgi:FkbM family methyltransferase
MVLELARTLRHNISRGYSAIAKENRIPGRIQRVFFDCLHHLGKRTVDIRQRNGYVITCFAHSYTMLVEIWQKREYDFEGFDYGEGATILDIGANQGIFTLYAARNGASVYAFEPCAENIDLLRRNVARNCLEGTVYVHESAVTGRQSEVKLFVGTDRRGGILSGSASIVSDNRGGTGVMSRIVDAVPVNELFERCGVGGCDLVKIDCEGAEYEIFDAISEENLHRIKRIAVEFHRKGGNGIAERLMKAGFDIVRKDISETGIIKALRH